MMNTSKRLNFFPYKCFLMNFKQIFSICN
jgi:hypothetical protein